MHYRSVQLGEYYNVICEPGTYHLTHFSSEDGKARTIAKKLFDLFKDTALEHKLAIVGTDGTASMVGKYNGCIRGLQELLNKPFQWIVCLLHTNKLFCDMFGVLDGSTSGPDTFAGPIGKKIIWTCAKLDSYLIPTIVSAFFVFFSFLPEQVVSELSTDQVYAYNICWAFIHGKVDNDLAYLEFGPIVHSSWLTL